ncbi:MAG: class I SAM-dependent methyltransferase [Rhodanobacteraceae bacterium]|nr:class I SAM-dependent methyltransferase [Rhodanobacteraceae bacterium]
MSRLLRRLWTGLALLDARAFGLRVARCPFCGPTLFVRLNASDAGVRCLRCAASAVHLQLGAALRALVPDLALRDACELSAQGPLVEFLRRHARSVALSEYFSDVPPGGRRGTVRCEDVQRLTYADASFDLVMHSEVLEHVPDDTRALCELRRVLRPGGIMLFTVPLHGGERTVQRARLRAGELEHLCEPVYHADPLRRDTGILAFRDYGRDILDQVRAAGFAEAHLVRSGEGLPWLAPRDVVFARR